MKTISEYTVSVTYKILGFNDDQCSCDVCGKQELKGTYMMENLITGEIFRAGSSCGSKMAKWTTKELVGRYKAGEKDKIEYARNEFRNSKEYIAYDNALELLNKESDDISTVVLGVSSQDRTDGTA